MTTFSSVDDAPSRTRFEIHQSAPLRTLQYAASPVSKYAATSPSVGYAETRKFYEAKGFTSLEVFPKLWDPHNPALQMIKVLNST